jgi:hypothetical protein
MPFTVPGFEERKPPAEVQSPPQTPPAPPPADNSRSSLNLDSVAIKNIFSIDNFRSKVNSFGGFQKTNRFYVEIFSPKWTNDTMDRLKFLCEAAELPGKTILTSDAKIYGPAYKVATGTVFNEITLTFISTNDMKDKLQFDLWMNSIQNPRKFHMSYRDEYVGTVSIIALSETPEIQDPKAAAAAASSSPMSLIDKIPSSVVDITIDAFRAIKNRFTGGGAPQNEAAQSTPEVPTPKVYWVKLIDAFPVAIAPVPLSWSDDGFMRFQVTFAYHRWEGISETIAKMEEVVVQGNRFANPLKYVQKISALVNSANKENLKNMAIGRLENTILDAVNDTDGGLRKIIGTGENAVNNYLNQSSEKVGLNTSGRKPLNFIIERIKFDSGRT